MAEGLEHLTDKTLRRPVGKTDLAARSAYPQHFGSGFLLLEGKHYAVGRDDSVKTSIGERQGLRIGFPERDVQAVCLSTGLAAREQGRNKIRRCHCAPAPRRCQRDISVAGRDVEHALAGPQIERLAQLLADDLQGRAYDCVISGRPGAVLTRFEVGEIE